MFIIATCEGPAPVRARPPQHRPFLGGLAGAPCVL